MRLGYVANDFELFEKFKKIDEFTEIKKFTSVEQVDLSVDILIVSDRFTNINDLIEFKKSSQIGKVYFMVSNEAISPLNRSLLESNDVIIVPPKRTAQQIVEMVCSLTFGQIKTQENVFVFFGADEKVGVTNVSQSVVESLSKNKNMKIFYAFLNGKPSVEYMESFTGISVDELRTKLDSNILTDGELIDSCTKVGDNVFVLKGTDILVNRRLIKPIHVERLIKLASNTFDVVIIDAGSNVEFGMVIGALNSTSNKFLVATQQEKTVDHFHWVKSNVLDVLKISDFSLILNKYVQSSYLESDTEFAKKIGLTLAVSVPMSDFSWQSEKDKKTIYSLGDKSFQKAITDISTLILKQLKILVVEQEKKFSWNSFFKRGA